MTDQEMFKFFIKWELKDQKKVSYRLLSNIQQQHFGDQYGKCTLIKKLQKSNDVKYVRAYNGGNYFRINF